jgi:hypothetical protein
VGHNNLVGRRLEEEEEEERPMAAKQMAQRRRKGTGEGVDAGGRVWKGHVNTSPFCMPPISACNQFQPDC